MSQNALRLDCHEASPTAGSRLARVVIRRIQARDAYSTAVCRSAAIDSSSDAQSSVVPPTAAAYTVRSDRGSSLGSPSRSSSGPASSAVPSAATHSQPERNTTVISARCRKSLSLSAAPRDTKPTIGMPVRGWSTMPAFTTEARGRPLDRVVIATARPSSRVASSRAGRAAPLQCATSASPSAVSPNAGRWRVPAGWRSLTVSARCLRAPTWRTAPRDRPRPPGSAHYVRRRLARCARVSGSRCGSPCRCCRAAGGRSTQALVEADCEQLDRRGDSLEMVGAFCLEPKATPGDEVLHGAGRRR